MVSSITSCFYFDLGGEASLLAAYWQLRKYLSHKTPDLGSQNLFWLDWLPVQHSISASSCQHILNTFAFSNLNDHCQLLNRSLSRPFLSHICSILGLDDQGYSQKWKREPIFPPKMKVNSIIPFDRVLEEKISNWNRLWIFASHHGTAQ